MIAVSRLLQAATLRLRLHCSHCSSVMRILTGRISSQSVDVVSIHLV